MRLMKKTSRIIVTTALLLSISMNVFAEPTIDSLNKQKQQLEGQKSQFNENIQQNQMSADSAQKEINNINKQIWSLDSKIEELNRNINDTKSKITSKQSEINATQIQLDKTKDDVKDEQELFNKRMKAMYMGGMDQYLNVLLSSESFSELYMKTQAIASIIKFDNKLIKDLSDKSEAINQIQIKLENEKNELMAYKKDNENKLAEVQSNVQQQKQLIAQAKSRQAYFMSQISEYRNKVAANDKQVQDTIKQLKALAQNGAGSNQPSRGEGTPAAPNSLIAYAYKFLGSPYVWGAAGGIFTQADINMYKNTSHDLTGMEKLLGRQAFDCSGLMQYVYGHFGIHLTRTTFTQINEGTAVSKNNLQPGDLIFFGTYSDPHHVGMYVGNNCYIEAPYSGEVVRISSLDNTDEYLCARRILN